MAHSSQPLLGTPKKATSLGKIMFLAVSISALIILVALSLPSVTKTRMETHVADPTIICHKALDPRACQDSVFRVVSDGAVPLDVTSIQKKFLIKQAGEMHRTMLWTENLRNQINEQSEHGALADCIELIDLSIDLVLDSVQELEKGTSRANANAQAWLSGILTNHATCLDGLGNHGKELLGTMFEDLISRASSSLAMLAGMSMPEDEMIQPLRGKLPSWVSPWERKLLQKTANAIKADLTVAKDCSGNYKTIAEAIAAAPNKSKKRYVIHVKKGTYKENVEVGKNKKNLMIIGDGMDSTIITGNLNVADGSTTFKSATLAAVGEGFILQDICIQNTAGPEKHQAVALRVGADQSVINRCRIDAYQDTLYTHSLRQFYRECNITGTVDFIFGNAAVVLQKCNLLARKPMKSQKNMVTAQGRTDPNQNTGTSIQDCEIRASADLEPVKSSYPTYLGRPWKEYSRTAVLESYIGDHVDPVGWSEWSGDFALNTLYYGEYMNSGPGAGTSKRVNWSGYHVIADAEEAMKFTVKELIQGGDWLSSTGVAFTEGL